LSKRPLITTIAVTVRIATATTRDGIAPIMMIGTMDMRLHTTLAS